MGRLATAVSVLAFALSGCLGGGTDEPRRIEGRVATVYASAPLHGAAAVDARAVLAGARRALAQRGGRAGGLRVRLRLLPSTEHDARPWDPGLVAANADRAADDPHAIAYLGEPDYGATAVSLPITNDAGLLQVSSGDGLTSLTVRPPGRPRAGPERYYPSGSRSFARIGPTDLLEAEALVRRVRLGGATSVALAFDRGIYGRELAAQVLTRARGARLEPVASEQYGDVDAAPDLAQTLAEASPDAVIVACLPGPGTARRLGAIAAALPGVPLYATSGVLAVRAPGLPAVEAVGPALRPEPAGYEAMRLVLDAVDQGGRDRRRVIDAARSLARSRRNTRLALYRPDPEGGFRRADIAP